jgi:8-oxo-dGTP diphosphatase
MRSGLEDVVPAAASATASTLAASGERDRGPVTGTRGKPVRKNLRAGVVIGAAIFRGPRLLLLRRAAHDPVYPRWWDVPGGSVEVNETLPQAVRREVFEETGFRVRVGRPYFVSTFRTHEHATGDRLTIVSIEFRCSESGSREPRLDPNEHSEYAWVSSRTLPRYSIPPRLLEAVRAAFADRREELASGGPAVRPRTGRRGDPDPERPSSRRSRSFRRRTRPF